MFQTILCKNLVIESAVVDGVQGLAPGAVVLLQHALGEGDPAAGDFVERV